MLLRYASYISLSGLATTLAVGAISGEWGVSAFGGALAVGCTLFGLWLAHRWLDVELKRVLSAVLSAMGLRLVLLSVGLFALSFTERPPIPYIAGFFAAHLFSQVFELLYIHRARLALLPQAAPAA